MTRLLSNAYDHLSCSAGYGTPDTHSHLALHFIFSLDTAFPGNAGGNDFEGKAVFIDSDVPHTLHLESCDAIVVLFEPVSALGRYVKETFLRDKDFYLPEKELLCRITELLACYPASCTGNGLCGLTPEQAFAFDRELLELLGWHGPGRADALLDERVLSVKARLSEMDTIPADIMKELCDTARLSQSRLSHLFSSQAGIPLHRYLAFMKIQKAFLHVRRGKNLTQAALDAGFDSPSHLASTFKRMFGISFSQFLKNAE